MPVLRWPHQSRAQLPTLLEKVPDVRPADVLAPLAELPAVLA